MGIISAKRLVAELLKLNLAYTQTNNILSEGTNKSLIGRKLLAMQ